MSGRYRWAAGAYDLLLEPLVRGFRRAGMRLAPTRPGLRVLDVGCGTGNHLHLYAAGGARVSGVDRSTAMLEKAAGRLGERGTVIEADAAALPFASGTFDLVIAATLLHELDPAARICALREMRRVAAPEGSLLVVDHHPEPPTGARGRLIRGFATSIERIAGGDHYRNYRQFVSSGGLPALAAMLDLGIARESIEASGTMGVYLLR
jgi:demethylmenaquinone methyltransferase/2-methoxy-6-polyprenyl-1,4-benzoquinol methylase